MDIKQICSWDNDLAVLDETGKLWLLIPYVVHNEDPLEVSHIWKEVIPPVDDHD